MAIVWNAFQILEQSIVCSPVTSGIIQPLTTKFAAAMLLYSKITKPRGLHSILHAPSGGTSRPAGETVGFFFTPEPGPFSGSDLTFSTWLGLLWFWLKGLLSSNKVEVEDVSDSVGECFRANFPADCPKFIKGLRTAPLPRNGLEIFFFCFPMSRLWRLLLAGGVTSSMSGSGVVAAKI